MKTIEEASMEAISDRTISVEELFEAGVEFAQQWINVEDELPTEEDFYFVKVKNSFPKDCNIVVAKFYDDNNTFYDENSDYPIEDAISWRPIEYK